MNQEEIINNIKKIAPRHCDNCGTKYDQDDFKIVQLNPMSALIHLNCKSCGSTYIINAFTNENGIGSQRIPLVLDLNGPTELEKFTQNGSGVSKDNAVDLYNLLQEKSTLETLFPVSNKIDKPAKGLNDDLFGTN
ncbi:hypothetical protein KBD45_01740 [Candidatus Dojkabacteria bacterium]|nr:hypothetical protein [Candidatus Dojkabacteria bacterium]